MDNKGLETLLAVTVVAALAPTIVSLLPRPGPPQVVILIFCGIIIGPAVLGLGDTHLTPLEHGLDAVGYGVFIPIFFVSSGMSLDVA
jgi:Kef-type K+ transport system membrane component KefB